MLTLKMFLEARCIQLFIVRSFSRDDMSTAGRCHVNFFGKIMIYEYPQQVHSFIVFSTRDMVALFF
jgi:hypothetical protein